ncbi:GxxExxY protein [Chryseobacterium sp.]|uniref:GxxExxY protein n=1 Tax=Chryseobacterium sp. TaxID=1871047 RepID=UPI002630A071|nr:GxxExxY protein [Chryseobacterium sp.]
MTLFVNGLRKYEEVNIAKASGEDLLIENKVIIEIKAVHEINDYDFFQLLII